MEPEANPEVAHIRFVTSRLLEAGLKPDKGHLVPFALNKTIPFGDINITKVLWSSGLGTQLLWFVQPGSHRPTLENPKAQFFLSTMPDALEL